MMGRESTLGRGHSIWELGVLMKRATFWNLAIVCMPVGGTSKGMVASEAREEGRVTSGTLPAMLSKRPQFS